ncbi:hypothetical protein ABT336_12065 [Micromonospora sp. NPDC000207]|uniref:hypothetical protein n=1 Tax=Micromonospora sp. NPDC000207 TaxID=3154246 RepID=UPI0033252FEF
MTPPMLTAVPPTVHRRRNPSRASDAHRDMSRRVSAALAANRPVTVTVEGAGAGWYVLAVGSSTYRLWRDGEPVTRPWSDVVVGSDAA